MTPTDDTHKGGEPLAVGTKASWKHTLPPADSAAEQAEPSEALQEPRRTPRPSGKKVALTTVQPDEPRRRPAKAKRRKRAEKAEDLDDTTTVVELRVAPKGVPIPHERLPGLHYRLNVRRGRPDLVPRMDARELRAFEIEFLEARIHELSRYVQFTAAVLNFRSKASKTTTSLYAGTITRVLTHKNVAVLLSTEATTNSTAAMSAGVSPDRTLTISQGDAEYPTYRDLSAIYHPNVFGLRVVSPDPSNRVSVANKFTVQRWKHQAKLQHDNNDVVIYDGGNDVVDEDSIALAAARDADVLVFTATAKYNESLFRLSATMGLFISDPQCESKAKNGIAVISRVGRRAKPQDFAHFTMLHDELGHPVPDGDLGFNGPLMMVHEDPYIADNFTTDPNEIKDQTYLDYLRLIEKMYVVAGTNQGKSLPEPEYRFG